MIRLGPSDAVFRRSVAVAPPTPHTRTPDSAATVLALLRRRGLRVSTPRRVIVQTLVDADGPLSAHEIAAGVDGGRTNLDVASVYRNLETLERVGLVRHLHTGPGPGRYLLATRSDREYLECERCGTFVEIESSELEGVRDELLSRFGYRVRFSQHPMVGVCPRCR